MKRGTFCHLLAIATGLFVTLPMLLLMFDNRACVVMGPASIQPEKARSGEVVTLTWTVNEIAGCEGKVIRRIVDARGQVQEFGHERTVYHEPGGGARTFTKKLAIPNAVPGKYTYQPVVYRWRNRVQWLFPSVEHPLKVPFEIIP